MPFHASRFRKGFRDVTGKEPASVMDTDPARYNHLTTPVQKARFIKALMDNLLRKTGRAKAGRIMQACGHTYLEGVGQCPGEPMIKKVKKLYQESKHLKDFLSKLNAEHIGGGHLKLTKGVIEASYDHCYCGSVSKTKEPIPIAYCHCSAGWYQRVFEEALGRPVKVQVLRSIISGADRCDFRIDIQR